MEFGNKKTIEPLEISYELVDQMYPADISGQFGRDYMVLKQLCEVFSDRTKSHNEASNVRFTCYIERMAFDAFVRFANDTYKEKGHEATGLIVGYYLYDKSNPESCFIVGTNFLKATGPTTRVTCEFSYEDSIRHSNYCDEHKVLPLIWIHSHPGFGAFYSGTDDSTLKTYYYAPYQVGVVVDNLQNQILGYKMYGENKRQENVYIFDLDKSKSDSLHFVYEKNTKNVFKKSYIDNQQSKKNPLNEISGDNSDTSKIHNTESDRNNTTNTTIRIKSDGDSVTTDDNVTTNGKSNIIKNKKTLLLWMFGGTFLLSLFLLVLSIYFYKEIIVLRNGLDSTKIVNNDSYYLLDSLKKQFLSSYDDTNVEIHDMYISTQLALDSINADIQAINESIKDISASVATTNNKYSKLDQRIRNNTILLDSLNKLIKVDLKKSTDSPNNDVVTDKNNMGDITNDGK